MTTDFKHGVGGKLGDVAGRSNEGKSILQTIDPEFILGIGRISAFGAEKYHLRNWLMSPGMKWSDVYESLLRHLMAFWGGEENDPESGHPHMEHISWNIMVLSCYSRRPEYASGDNRPSKIEWDGQKWEEWNKKFREAQELSVAKETIVKNTKDG